jgi:hypothetical protein
MGTPPNRWELTMARINLNDLSAQAGGLAYRANQVRTDPAVVQAAQDAWRDVKVARDSVAVLAREGSAAWQRTRTATPQSGVRPTTTTEPTPGVEPVHDRIAS